MSNQPIRMVFILSTGRARSTMLSEILGKSKEVTMLSELLATAMPGAFPATPINGLEFWKIFSIPHLKMTTLLKHGIAPKEILAANTANSEGIAPILLTTLPFLSRSPGVTQTAEEIFERLQKHFIEQPIKPAEEHYLDLFGLLMEIRGDFAKQGVLIERSGGSLRYTRELVEKFDKYCPTYVVLTRAAYPTITSMEEHVSFRLTAFMKSAEEIVKKIIPFNPFESPDRLNEILKNPEFMDMPEIRFIRPTFPGTEFDPKYVREAKINREVFAKMWAGMASLGRRELQGVEKSRVIRVDSEDLIHNTEKTIEALRIALGLDGGEWQNEGADIVQKPDKQSPPEPAHERAVQKLILQGTRAFQDTGTPLAIPQP